MSKEDLYAKIGSGSANTVSFSDAIKNVLDKFFESNVCIPKGNGRHIHADVMHAFVEGVKIQFKEKHEHDFRDTSYPAWDINSEYRVKPSEPIYEWQCIYKPSAETEYRLTSFMSQGEIMEWKSKHGSVWNICYLEETKRIRS